VRRFGLLALVALCGVVVVAMPGAARVGANGVPQLVKLVYLEGVSNFGPQNAEGVLEFSFAEAYARVDVKNLPPAQDYVYEGWMTRPDGGQLRVGELTLDASGIGTLATKLEALDSYDYNLFVVTGRPASAAGDSLPAERSIAGRFTVVGEDAASVPGEVRPRQLPDTGERPAGAGNHRLAIALALGAAVGLAAAAYRAARRKTE
jgi:hypothetical protein